MPEQKSVENQLFRKLETAYFFLMKEIKSQTGKGMQTLLQLWSNTQPFRAS